jgi:hypothetical protein
LANFLGGVNRFMFGRRDFSATVKMQEEEIISRETDEFY